MDTDPSTEDIADRGGSPLQFRATQKIGVDGSSPSMKTFQPIYSFDDFTAIREEDAEVDMEKIIPRTRSPTEIPRADVDHPPGPPDSLQSAGEELKAEEGAFSLDASSPEGATPLYDAHSESALPEIAELDPLEEAVKKLLESEAKADEPTTLDQSQDHLFETNAAPLADDKEPGEVSEEAALSTSKPPTSSPSSWNRVKIAPPPKKPTTKKVGTGAARQLMSS